MRTHKHVLTHDTLVSCIIINHSPHVSYKRSLDKLKIRLDLETVVLSKSPRDALCTVRGFEHTRDGDVTVAVLAVDFCGGGTLEEHLRRFGRPSAERVDAICSSLIRGLSALHASHIAARNIVLDRVLLTAEGDAKLACVGLVVCASVCVVYSSHAASHTSMFCFSPRLILFFPSCFFLQCNHKCALETFDF